LGKLTAERAGKRSDQSARALERFSAVLNTRLPADGRFENAPATVNARLSQVPGFGITVAPDDSSVQTLTGGFGNRTFQASLENIIESDRSAAWRLVFRDSA
jgi:hypothetical protein